MAGEPPQVVAGHQRRRRRRNHSCLAYPASHASTWHEKIRTRIPLVPQQWLGVYSYRR